MLVWGRCPSIGFINNPNVSVRHSLAVSEAPLLVCHLDAQQPVRILVNNLGCWLFARHKKGRVAPAHKPQRFTLKLPVHSETDFALVQRGDRNPLLGGQEGEL